MNPFSIACLAAGALTQFAIGIRLLRLSRRTHGAPEVLWGLTWSLAAVESTFDALSQAVPAPEIRALLRWGQGTSYPIVVMALLFANWRLFRPNERWAGVIGAAVSVSLVAVWLYQAFGPGLDVPVGGTALSLLNWAANLGTNAGLVWAMLETWRHYRMFDRRWRIGLVKRLLPVRYLMWFGSAVSLNLFFAVFWLHEAIVMPQWVADVSFPMASLLSVLLMWMTFFPPGWLSRRLDVEAPAP